MPQLTPVFRTDGNLLILGFEQFPGQEFNLSAVQGIEAKTMRIYLDEQESALDETGFWIVAEVKIPAKTWTSVPALDDSGEPLLDREGNPETRQEAAVLIEADIQIVLWDLREEEVPE